MPSVIKNNAPQRLPRGTAFNFDDMAQQARTYLAEVRSQAEKLVVQARQEADDIRKQAEAQGRAAGELAIDQLVERQVARQMETAMPALRQVITELQQARQTWHAHWDQQALRTAAAIAGRIIRREVALAPDVTLALVQEALELAAGSPQIRLLLHPADKQAFGSQVKQLAEQVARIATLEIEADNNVPQGSCRLETQHGVIDQTFQAQLARIEEELV